MADSRVIPTQAETDLPTFTIFSNGEEVGREIGIDSIQVVKSVNRIPTARLVVLDGSVPRENFEVSEGELFIPGSEIEIKAGYHADEDTIFKGIITKHSIKARQGKPSHLILEIKDVAVKMTIGRKSKYFEEMSDSEIIEDILSNYELENDVERTEVSHAEMVQHHVTDWDFLMSRAEVNGKLVIVDDGTISVNDPDLSTDPVVELAYGHNIIDFEAGMDARDQYASVKSSSWDMTNQEVIEGESEDPRLDEQGNIPSNDLSAVAGPDEIIQHHDGRLSNDELLAWSNARLLRSRLSKIKGKIRIQGFSGIKPGDVIDLAGFGDRFNGLAFVSSIGHRVSADSVWFTEIEFGLDKEPYSNKYEDIMDKPAGGLVPGVRGMLAAVVTNIHEDPDGEHRVRIKLPTIPDSEGIWARLALLDAGNERGSFFRPEVGDEVVVGFLNDDPRDPVILGSMYSSANAPPLEVEEENKQKGFITKREMKLVMDDDLVSITIETPGGNKIVLSEDEGAILIEDENANKIEMTSDGITLESPGDINISSQGDVNIEGVNVNITAQAQFKAEGSAGAEMSSSGQAVVNGSIVMIN